MHQLVQFMYLLHVSSHTNISGLVRNVYVLAEGIARFIYNVSELVRCTILDISLCSKVNTICGHVCV